MRNFSINFITALTFVFIFFNIQIFGQTDIKNKTSSCNLYLNNDSTYKDVSLTKDSDTTILLIKNDAIHTIPIAKIKMINFTKGSGFITGAKIGGVFGFAAGFLIGYTFKGSDGSQTGGFKAGIIGGTLLGISSALICGVIVMLNDKDKIYTFPEGITHEKVKRIKYLIKKNS